MSALADVAHDPFAVPCHAFAIHVARERHEAGLGEASRPPARVVVEPYAAVHDENARPLARTLRVDHKKPSEASVAISANDLLGLQSHTVVTVTNLLEARLAFALPRVNLARRGIDGRRAADEKIPLSCSYSVSSPRRRSRAMYSGFESVNIRSR